MDLFSGSIKKSVCSCFDPWYWGHSQAGRFVADDGSPCCSEDGSDWYDSCKPGCEKWMFVSGLDETMMNSDMGLYYNFTTDSDNIPTGCSGLQNFRPAMWGSIPHGTFNYHYTWPVVDGVQQEPACQLTTYTDSAHDVPLHQVVEEYANDSAAFVADFYPTLEKMLKNGYGDDDFSFHQELDYRCNYIDDILWTNPQRYYVCQ